MFRLFEHRSKTMNNRFKIVKRLTLLAYCLLSTQTILSVDANADDYALNLISKTLSEKGLPLEKIEYESYRSEQWQYQDGLISIRSTKIATPMRKVSNSEQKKPQKVYKNEKTKTLTGKPVFGTDGEYSLFLDDLQLLNSKSAEVASQK
jgi:hypothetical protein